MTSANTAKKALDAAPPQAEESKPRATGEGAEAVGRRVIERHRELFERLAK